MNIVFISTGLYPNQHAAAIRHSTIAQGMVENGHVLNFFLITAQPWEDNVIAYNGVKYTCLNDYKGNNKLNRFVHYLTTIQKLKKAIVEIHAKSKIDGIVLFSIDVLLMKVLLSFTKKNQIKIFHERTELPHIVGRDHSIIGTLMYNFYINHLLPRFDGLFVISDKLKNIISTYNKNVEKILTVVDIGFFRSIEKRKYDFPYIAYCGNMGSKKDGLPVLLEAFARLSKGFPLHKLVLIGNSNNDHEMENIKLIINQSNIQDKVIFTGFINRDCMPQLLCNADLLVVSKPDNEQNSGNFPIKIGEYLATGVPVVVTKVGEIPKFIKDGFSGYLAEPDSPYSFYKKMEEALSDKEKSLEIGLNGRKIAEEQFDYRIQSDNMIKYISKINLAYGS